MPVGTLFCSTYRVRIENMGNSEIGRGWTGG